MPPFSLLLCHHQISITQPVPDITSCGDSQKCLHSIKKKKEKRKNQRQNNSLNMILLSSKLCIYIDIFFFSLRVNGNLEKVK